MKNVYLSSLLTLIVVSVLLVTDVRAQHSEDSIVGVWRLVELTNWSSDGVQTQPFGAEPLGTFSYTPAGNLSIHIMRTPPIPKYSERPDNDAIADFARAYLAYFGTYSVDDAAGVVTHEVQGALYPNYVATDRPRPFSISADTLTLDFQSDSGARYLRRLVRIESFD